MLCFSMCSTGSHCNISSPQLPGWWLAAWSTLTAGTRARWSACVGTRRTSTHWVPAPCAGHTSSASLASLMLSYSPSWPLCWGIGRITSSHLILKWKIKVSKGSWGWAPSPRPAAEHFQPSAVCCYVGWWLPPVREAGKLSWSSHWRWCYSYTPLTQ